MALAFQLTDLPAPSGGGNPPQLASGTVALFKDSNWNSQRLDIRIADYLPGQRQTILKSMLDQATWIAFNLPLGTVM